MEHRRSSSRSRSRQQTERSFTEKCKDYLRQFLAFLFSNIGIICLVIGYTIAGAFIFIYVEAADHDKHSDNLRRNMSLTRNDTVAKLWSYTCCHDMSVHSECSGVEATRRCPRVSYGNVAPITFLGKITTIAYAIAGYGNVAPITFLGKITTIAYAIAGMPLFLLYLSNIGDILAKSFKWIYAKCCLCRGCPTRPRDLQKTIQDTTGAYNRRRSSAMNHNRRWNARNGDSEYEDSDFDTSDEEYDSSEEEEEEEEDEEEEEEEEEGEEEETETASSSTAKNDPQMVTVPITLEEEEGEEEETETASSSTAKNDPQMVTVPITLCLMIMVGYIYGGAVLFSKWEDWNILDGSYFCFISLSTIGFGDIVPGDKITGKNNDIGVQTLELSFILCAMYLMLGMALIAMCFNLMQEEVVHKMRTCSEVVRRIARCRR
ncbi:potassium channel subfamily K member 18-like [Diaphorina citri]|uniref:Potassium channel subfamily K member 18-like n=1 Tax=Diaphorina citri TaxID=121845 RepID=A0A3Q0INB4_DIACI|nr:potassium channel subfamily K member 18-like [Diaphorina citri]